jgi:hypothetical protein
MSNTKQGTNELSLRPGRAAVEMAARRSKSCSSGGGRAMSGGGALEVSSNPRVMSGGVSPLLSPPQIVSRHHSRARAKPQKVPAPPRFRAQACVSVQFSAACPASAPLPRRLCRLGARGRFVPAYGRKRGASLPLCAYSHRSECRTAPILLWISNMRYHLVNVER